MQDESYPNVHSVCPLDDAAGTIHAEQYCTLDAVTYRVAFDDSLAIDHTVVVVRRICESDWWPLRISQVLAGCPVRAVAVQAARLHIGLSQRKAAQAADIALLTWRSMEAGSTVPRPLTLAATDRTQAGRHISPSGLTDLSTLSVAGPIQSGAQ